MTEEPEIGPETSPPEPIEHPVIIAEAPPVEPPPVEEPPPPVQEPPPPPPPAAKAPKPAKVKKSGGVWPVLSIIGFLILAAGEVYLWHLDQTLQQTAAAQPESSAAEGPAPIPEPAAPASNAAPAAPAAPGATPPEQTAAAPPPSTQTPGSAAPPPGNATGTNAEIASLQNEIAALQQAVAKSQPAPDSIATQADLSEKLAELGAQVSALQTALAADHATVTSLASNGADLGKLSAKIQLLNQLAAARMALDSGQPVGDIPGAPAALAAFATTPPPTMAELVLTFPAAAEAANTASVEKAGKHAFWSSVAARLENLVTISNGDHVILGAPAAAITAQAQTQLDAGDLAGAVATLTNNLSDTTQAAMGGWLTKAKALLAARAALLQMSQS